MPQTFKALKQLKIGEGFREAGELVPEASDWPNTAVWVREGHIEPYSASNAEMQEHLKKHPVATKKKTGKRVVVKKAATATRKKRIVKKVKKDAGRQLAEHSV